MMKTGMLVATAALLMTAPAFAQPKGTPAYDMKHQKPGHVAPHGASSFAPGHAKAGTPGHQMQDQRAMGKTPAKGASTFTPAR